MPNIVDNVGWSDAVGVRMRLLVDAVKCREDRVNGYLRWRKRQLMAAKGTARAPHEASASERAQHLMEIRFRDLLPRRNVPIVHRPLASAKGELKQRSDAVVRPA